MHYRQLTFAERRCIAEIVESEPEISARCIARRLGRSPSTICAEIHRNSRPDGTYLATYAQETTIARQHSPRGAYKKDNPDILEVIVVGLQKRWSPKLISIRLKKMYPHDRSRQMSHETIYALIREDRAYGGTWYRGLPQAGRKRRKRYGSKEKRGRIKNRVGIEKRPKVVDSRSRIGDWEGDTVEGCKGSGGLSTFVERKTQLLAMSLLQGGSAKEMNHATRRGFNRHPGVPLKTVTVDNGREFAEHEALSK